MTIDNPQNYGKRLIPQILDSLAVAEPDRIIYSLSSFPNGTSHFQPISAGAFTKAVDKTAWWLHNQVRGQDGTQNGDHGEGNGDSSKKILPLGYIGPRSFSFIDMRKDDLRHILLIYGAIKANCAALFLSPKNNTEGALAVLNAAKCDIWVKPHEQATLPLVESFTKQKPMMIIELPSLEELLDADTTEPFPFQKTFEEAVNEPFCITHTSGTTGVPKPISWTHGLIGSLDAVRLLPPTEGDQGLVPWTDNWNEGDTIYSSFPMSHGAGMLMDIVVPAFFKLHCVLGPPGVLPNLGLLENLVDYANIDIWHMVPSLADELGESRALLPKFKSAKFICVSGGPVSPAIVKKVNEVVRVMNLTGTTEGLFMGNLWPDREDWHWFAFHPLAGFEFKEIEPGVYEHWVNRQENWDLFQGVFYTFPDQQSVNLKDLYMRHPTKPYLYAYTGRSDDAVVLSNGYKIAPLDTEALITTHPAIEGCLVIGTGKPQAGLLIELKDPSTRNNELFDSIWEIVERANHSGFQKIRLQRDYVAFTEPDKPFFRTDKSTIKRRATLELYTEFIDRFYSTRDEAAINEDFDVYTIDTTSDETVLASVRKVLASIIPEIDAASPDEDVFDIGLDSLLVFQAIRIIRAATGLQEQLAPRHLYANPTLTQFSAQLASILQQHSKPPTETLTNGHTNGVDKQTNGDPVEKQTNVAVREHKRRAGFKMNPFDAVNPNHYMGFTFFFALPPGSSFRDAFKGLQDGLCRAFQIIPELDGKMMHASEHEFGYKKGEYAITIPPPSLATTSNPRQLIFKDMTQALPSFEKMRSTDFAPSLFADKTVLDVYPFPSMPADLLVAHANFVEGGCILAANFIHTCFDGSGALVALKVWAECCRYMQGDLSATCDWYDPESFNHSLPEILYLQEGHAKPALEVDPKVWDFLPYFPPEDMAKFYESKNVPKAIDSSPADPRPVYRRQPQWPTAPSERSLASTFFLITRDNLQRLKHDVNSDPEVKGLNTSISDIVQAFMWRTSIRARYLVAKAVRGQTFGKDEMSILEIPIDGRLYFSSQLPSSYMGSLLIMSRTMMPVEELCSPSTSLAKVASLIRKTIAKVNTALVHDTYTLLRSMPDYTKPGTANMGLEHMNEMISNMILWQPEENLSSFGAGIFAGGKPEAVWPQIERGHRRFRFSLVHPLRADGGVELELGTLPEELKMLQNDEPFTKYAKLLDIRPGTGW
ncbi:acetyl-CoA synthetase-like protein [Tothia fuscella]|uniref:Acetyl-CoA synthetase-like protein n=1 Tax=Tothia fuscella TaxID=1048955 RepID=A0A9P4NGK2_9PEZI|nr:acetyl-CoA synthetase-like protein [Tothia fuscella]